MTLGFKGLTHGHCRVTGLITEIVTGNWLTLLPSNVTWDHSYPSNDGQWLMALLTCLHLSVVTCWLMMTRTTTTLSDGACIFNIWYQFISVTLKSSPILNYKNWARSWSQCLGSQPSGDISQCLGCRYFPPGLRLLSQPKRSPIMAGTKLYCLVTEAHRYK